MNGGQLPDPTFREIWEGFCEKHKQLPKTLLKMGLAFGCIVGGIVIWYILKG
jgi:hypothetical protein